MSDTPIHRGVLASLDAPARRSALAGALAEAALGTLEVADASSHAILHARTTDLPGEIARRADRCTITAADATLVRVTPDHIEWQTASPYLARALDAQR